MRGVLDRDVEYVARVRLLLESTRPETGRVPVKPVVFDNRIVSGSRSCLGVSATVRPLRRACRFERDLWSSYEGQTVDALAAGGDEGRG